MDAKVAGNERIRELLAAALDGQLSEERDSLLVQALVTKGDYDQARERVAAFRRRYPASLFAPAIDQALQSIP